MGGLFIFVVLVMRDGIIGTLGKWIRRHRFGSIDQVIAESDATAADRQRDFRPAGADRRSEEI
jgi:hypothetical protein